jgi:hypothetical protein
VAGAADCEYGTQSGMGELLVLSRLLPANDPVLGLTLAPVFEGPCQQARRLALGMALWSYDPYPALERTLRFCSGLRSAEREALAEELEPDVTEELVP